MPSAGQVRQSNGKFSKPDGNDEIDEVVLREVIAAAGALSTPPEPAQMAQAAATARNEYAPPSDGAGAVADVTALVAQSMAKAGMDIPGGPAALEAFLLQQPAPAGELLGDTNLRQMLPREVIAQKTEIARQAFEMVSEQLARGGGKRANTARKLREQQAVTVTVPVARQFCFNGLWVEMPSGTYDVPFDIAGHYTRSVLLAAATEREDLQMRWQQILNPEDPLAKLRRIEPTRFRIS